MTARNDEQARRTALDPGRSFIVEAPAGSGKTELLIQRFLRLLAGVARPEQIVAITFTRKAAAEMRGRVVDTLKAAATGGAPAREHRQSSIELAGAALAHAEKQGWSLIDQPQRLRIMTIDALNASLARQFPILANGIASLTIADDAGELYALAAKRTTESLADPGPLGAALRTLLAAADNSLTVLEQRLAGSLPQRERWLRVLALSGSERLAASIAASLSRLEDDRIEALHRLAGEQGQARLFSLLERRAAGADGSEQTPGAGGEAPPPLSGAAAWRTAAGLLLTAKGEWRRRFTRKGGFPAEDKALREQLDEVREYLHAIEGMRENLAALAALPPAAVSRAQAEQLHAVELVLPRLLAELRVLFARRGGVDHTELSLAAQQALGACDSPSELLLALDHRIEHILVDEFQDTSRLQWRLLERLTAGWQTGDGHTLFLVGDPMQSIYRFRDADLSLFLRARRQGLGSVELTPITLHENHRSAREIVEWVNSAFAPLFPKAKAVDSELPSFHESISPRAPDSEAGVELQVLAGEPYDAEIARIVGIVRGETERDPGQSIGILVRSRTHLIGLRAALRHEGVSAHAIEIDSLTDTQLGQDLIGLTMALAHPGDRLAWLGVLRSPWCGLTWADLKSLCGGDGEDGDETVYERLEDPDQLARLSADGRRRAEWLADRLRAGFALRSTRSFGRWVRDCWIAIDGPAALADASALDVAERYFAELDRLARGGDIDDPAALRSRFAAPAADAGPPMESGVEIMTMHRAKGLEFDAVILPGLGRTIRGSETKLLYYIDINLADSEEGSLLAAGGQRRDAVLDYVSAIDRERDAAERSRLLYVAATRARRRLYLLGSVDRRTAVPQAGSLLATLWPGLGDLPVTSSPSTLDKQADGEPVGVQEQHEGTDFITIPLRRLGFDAGLPPAAIVAEEAVDGQRPEFEWVHPASVQVGTLIHGELQRLAEAAVSAGRPVPPAIDLERYRRRLALLGVEGQDLDAAAERVAEALTQVWSDRTGRWILKPWAEAWSELRLTVRQHDRLEHVALDRSFVDEQNRRWIIDYKTGRHLGGDVEQFLDDEVARYRDQLERYALAVADIDSRPLRVGLYFPLMSALRSWEPGRPALAPEHPSAVGAALADPDEVP